MKLIEIVVACDGCGNKAPYDVLNRKERGWSVLLHGDGTEFHACEHPDCPPRVQSVIERLYRVDAARRRHGGF